MQIMYNILYIKCIYKYLYKYINIVFAYIKIAGREAGRGWNNRIFLIKNNVASYCSGLSAVAQRLLKPRSFLTCHKYICFVSFSPFSSIDMLKPTQSREGNIMTSLFTG